MKTPHHNIGLIVAVLLLQMGCVHSGFSQSPRLDLSKATIVQSGESGQSQAGKFLQQEVERRTGVKLALSNSLPGGSAAAIVLGRVGGWPGRSGPPAGLSVPGEAEGYAIWVERPAGSGPVVCLEGRDGRGTLFAAGRLLRLLDLAPEYVRLGAEVRLASAPAEPIRAQQLISSTQSKDGFVNWRDLSQKQQYIRDLVLFGANGFEPRPATDVAQFLEDLGLDLFLVVSCQAIIEHSSLSDEQVRKLYTDVVGVDHFTTYGGDASGSRPPQEVFPKMERVVPLILQSHPRAKWWYSNQCLDDHAVDYDDYIFNYLKTREPDWLYGMVYGPWTKRGIGDIRAWLPPQYKLRQYPEICHVRWCQYPVPQWDRVWAQVWPRNQSIYAMPRMMAQIHQATRRDTVGFLPYNHTGSYNDLNKFIWTARGWDPDAKVEDLLYEYGKVFFASEFKAFPAGSVCPAGADAKAALIEAGARAVARGLELLEENWKGNLADNTSCEAALKTWKEIATCMGGASHNWRLELFLCKAFLDAQVKRKYDAELKLEREAYQALEQAETHGIATALRQARSALARIDTEFQSMAAFKAELQAWKLTGGFGDLEAVLTNIYSPLSDRKWLEAQMEAARTLADIKKIVNYEDPGPGGFYDDLGVEGRQPHLVRQKAWQEDPGFVYSPIEWVDAAPGSARRHSQLTHAVCRYDTPLQMRWEGLEPGAKYHIEVVYLGPFGAQITCETADGHLIHGPRGATGATPVSYSIPQACTGKGVLALQWKLANKVRGVSVTEIWLVKE